MEKQMADVFTRKYYYIVQDQLWESYNYNLVVTSEDEISCRLKVRTLLEKRGLLFQQYSHVIDSVVLSEEASKLFCETMESLIEKIKSLLNSNEGVEPCATRRSTHQTGFRELDEVRTKGRAKRIKRGKEKANGKGNSTSKHCHGCGKDGQTRDKRNCPVLLNLNQSADNLSGEDIDNDSSSQTRFAIVFSFLILRIDVYPRNSIEGNIPDVFHGNSYFMVLDLSYNNLKGKIPGTLSSAKYIGHLDLSHNHLCGNILMGDPFDHMDASSFTNNDCLCGNPLSTC
ncbi:hypothetical protein ACLB2K_077580 [Fragaria x ananassa]